MFLVDWRIVNARFCVAVWALALVLAVVVLVHVIPSTHAPQHPVHSLPR